MRYWVLVIGLGLILSFAAACSSDDDSDGDDNPSDQNDPTEVSEPPTSEPEPEPEPDPTATPEPEPTPTQEPEPTPTAEPEDTESNESGELDDLLLTLEDMPEGWVESPEEINAEVEAADVEDEPFEAPCGVQPLDETFEPVAEASRTFQGSELGPFFAQNIARLNSADEAEQVMGQVREMFGCEEWVETDDLGDEVTFEISETQVDSLGDDTYSVRLGMTFADAPETEMFGDFAFNMVFVRMGEYLNMFSYVDIFGMTDVDFDALMQRGSEKVQAGI